MATACDFNKEEVISDNEPTCQKCTDMGRLINAKREKINISSKPEQVQILKITPASWSMKREYLLNQMPKRGSKFHKM